MSGSHIAIAWGYCTGYFSVTVFPDENKRFKKNSCPSRKKQELDRGLQTKMSKMIDALKKFKLIEKKVSLGE